MSYNGLSCYLCGDPLDGILCRRCSCGWCGNKLDNGFCSYCASKDGNSFAYDPNPNSFDNSPNFSYPPPQPQFETYSCELCGNDSHYGYDCPSRVPLVYEPEPYFNEWGSEVRKKEQAYNEERCSAARRRMLSITFVDEDDYIPLGYIIARYSTSKAITPDLPNEEPNNLLSMGDEHLSTSDENLVPIPSEFEVTSDNESECDMPVNDESSSIFTTFSNPLFDSDDDFSSSDDELFSDEDVLKEIFKIYSNLLFDDEEIISTKIEPHHFNAKSDLIESLLNQNILTVSNLKIDSFLEEFFGELAHIDLIPPGINKADFDSEEEIRLIEELLYDSSSPRPPEESNSEISDATIESSFPSPILVEGSDSFIEEIDLFLASNDSMPPGIKNNNYDSKGDIRFLEELFINDSPPLPKNESSNLDHFNEPSSSRPPSEPPDVEICYDVEPVAAVTNDFDVLNNDEPFDPREGENVVFLNVEEDDSFTFTIRTFLPFVTYPEVSPLSCSTRSEDTIFDPGIFT
ncbi:hypothetical protein Tco_1274905 [Tanacetum coccineum]